MTLLSGQIRINTLNYRYVVANDLSASAVEDIRRNVEWNGLLPPGPIIADGPVASTSGAPMKPVQISKADRQAAEDVALGKIRINEGDAWLVFTTLI